MGVVLVFLLLVETFVCGHLISRVKDLRDENELLRESLPYYHTDDWHDVLKRDSEVNGGE